jgi:hypothetical protein
MLSEKQLRIYLATLVLLIITILFSLAGVRLFNPIVFIWNCLLFSTVTVILLCATGMFFILYSERYNNFARSRVKNVFTYYFDRGICFSDPFFLASIAAISLTATLRHPQPLIGYPPIYLLFTVWFNFERTDRSILPINIQLKKYVLRLIRKEPDPRYFKPFMQLTDEITAFIERTDDLVFLSDIRNIAVHALNIKTELDKEPNPKLEGVIVLYLTYVCRFIREFEKSEKLTAQYRRDLKTHHPNPLLRAYRRLFLPPELDYLKLRTYAIKLFAWNLSQKLGYILQNIRDPNLSYMSLSEFILDLRKRGLI